MNSYIRLLPLLLIICFSSAFSASRDLSVDAPKSTDQLRKVALVIGNSKYKDVASLKNPANDARSMAVSLNRLGFEVTELIDANQKEMNRALGQFGRKLNADSIGLFYYAGHGLQVRGRNYLVPVDALIDGEASVPTETVEVDAVLAQLTVSSLSIVILDACRNNPFEKSLRSTSGGLAQIDAPKGSFIAFATSPGKTAADGSGGNGLYTTELLKQMSTPNLSIESVFKRVRANVSRLTGDAQIPWENTSLVGDFYFRQDDSKEIEINRQEAKRKAEELKQAEMARKQQEENLRVEEARRKLEEIKQAEEVKRLEQVRRSEEAKRKAEELKQAEMARKQQEENLRVEEARRKLEEIKQAEEVKRLEQVRRSEEAKRKAEELKQAEMARKQQEENMKAEEAGTQKKAQNVSQERQNKLQEFDPRSTLSDRVALNSKSLAQVKSEKESRWHYSYKETLAGKSGEVIFGIYKEGDHLKEFGYFDLMGQKFDMKRDIPKQNEIVSFDSRNLYHEFLPYANFNNALEKVVVEKLKVKVPFHSYLSDHSWNFIAKPLGKDVLVLNGVSYNVNKISISGRRWTGPGHCEWASIGRIDANVWYATDIKRYLKQEIKSYSCEINGIPPMVSNETYEIIDFVD